MQRGLVVLIFGGSPVVRLDHNVLKHLAGMFALIGRSEGVRVCFADAPKRVLMQHDCGPLVRGLSDLLYKIINILPPGADLSIRVESFSVPLHQFYPISGRHRFDQQRSMYAHFSSGASERRDEVPVHQEH